jgi:hypothetical protein
VNDERRPLKSAAATKQPNLNCTSFAERMASRELDDELLMRLVRGVNQVDRAVKKRHEALRRAA